MAIRGTWSKLFVFHISLFLFPYSILVIELSPSCPVSSLFAGHVGVNAIEVGRTFSNSGRRVEKKELLSFEYRYNTTIQN